MFFLYPDNPATKFTKADGVKGKQMNKNNGPNPLRSTQLISFCTRVLFVKNRKTRFSPYFRINKNTAYEPAVVPIHDIRIPYPNPKALAFAKTNTNKGKKGKNDSINGNRIPINGPNAL